MSFTVEDYITLRVYSRELEQFILMERARLRKSKRDAYLLQLVNPFKKVLLTDYKIKQLEKEVKEVNEFLTDINTA